MSTTTAKEVILTGDRPTGPLHLGHYVGSLRQRVELQNRYEQFIIIADAQALTDNASNPEKIRQNILEVTLDYLAIGIDPKITTIFIQSLVPELAELTMYYLNLVSVARLQLNPTVKDEIKQRQFGGGVPAGFFCYPVSQAADITAFKANFIPVGADQIPVIEQSAEIVRNFNRTYNCTVLVEPKALLSNFSRLPGTDGKGKMSKSSGNAIYLCDNADTIKNKVKSMYTDPTHLKVSDPGRIEGNAVFIYLDAFDDDKKALSELKEHYQRGGLADTTVKNRLTDVLIHKLSPIATQRKEYAKDLAQIMAILKKGTEEAKEVAAKTLCEVKNAMQINYFSHPIKIDPTFNS